MPHQAEAHLQGGFAAPVYRERRAAADPVTWLEFNERLVREASALNLNERWLEEQITGWSQLTPSDSRAGWLTLARINELALLCAGSYVDCGELTAAGDLLVNPRLINIQVLGRSGPLVKERHSRLTDQLNGSAGKDRPTPLWMAANTHTEIRRKPILQDIFELLEDSGDISEDYLRNIRKRMEAIAEAMGFITAWHLPPGADLQVRLLNASPGDRALMESKLCRFDKGLFWAIGRDLRRLAFDPDYPSWFLRWRCGLRM